MKFIKKSATLLVAALLVLVNTNPVPVYAENSLASDPNRTVYYEVQKGDCLWKLAERFGVSISKLTEANNLDEGSILEQGQQLEISLTETRYYNVKQGDTLWGIAREFGIAVEELEEANGISAESALTVDRELIIPKSGRIFTETDDVSETSDYALGLSDLTVWPVTGQVSSEFGQRWGRRHEGLDIAAEEGKPIRALEAGTVVFAGRRGTYGKTVIINHGNGFRSLYAHSSSLEVSPGEYVEQGQTVARVGSTGHSTGPHLHLEILYKGTPLNPETYLPTGEGQI